MAEIIYLTGIEQARGCLEAARAAEENGEIADATALLEMHGLFMRKTDRGRVPSRTRPSQPCGRGPRAA